MQVVSDVMNIDGMLLIPAGCELTQRQIGILQTWGVAEVEVNVAADEEESDPLANVPAETLAAWTAEVKARFWQVDESNPIFQETVRLLLLRRARRAVPG